MARQLFNNASGFRIKNTQFRIKANRIVALNVKFALYSLIMNDFTHRQPVSENVLFRFLVSPERRVFRHLLLVVFIGVVLYNSAAVIESPTTIFVYFVTIFYLNMYVLALSYSW